MLWNLGRAFEAHREYDLKLCVDPNGCFLLDIEDAYGDGLCCNHGNGSYAVLYGGQEVGSGSRFTDAEQVSLGNC